MKKNKKKIIIIISIVVVVAIILFFVFRKKKDKNITDETQEDINKVYNSYNISISSNPENKSIFDNLPEWDKNTVLRMGTRNKGVYMLQTALNKINNAGLVVDGIFGLKTKAALNQYYNTNEVDIKLALKLLQLYK